MNKMNAFDPLDPLKDVTLYLSDEQIEIVTDWFNTNAKPNDLGTILVAVEPLMEFLAMKKFHKRGFSYPTYMELMKEVELFQQGRYVTLDQVLYMLNKWVVHPNVKHELTLAYALFDTEKRGYLDLTELAYIVTMYEEKLNDAELIEFMRDCDAKGDGTIYYEELVDSFFSLAPELWDLLEKQFLYEDPTEDPSVIPDPEPEPEIEPEHKIESAAQSQRQLGSGSKPEGAPETESAQPPTT